MDAETSLEDADIKRFSYCGVYTVRFTRRPNNGFSSRRTFQFIGELGVTVGCIDLMRSTAEIKHQLIKSTSLSRVRPIADEAFRFPYVAREEKASLHFVHLIFIR